MTAPGRGAIAVVNVDGPRSLESVAKFFRPANRLSLFDAESNRPLFGHWTSSVSKDPSEELVVLKRNESVVEVQCHGGYSATERILADLEKVNVDIVDWNAQNPPCSTADQARSEIPFALTQKAAAILLRQSEGALDRELDAVTEMIEEMEVNAACSALNELSNLGPIGEHLTRPWNVLMAGPPNVGKSLLTNRVLGFERSIVFDQPGTTRDVLTSITAFNGWPIQLVDTAGVHQATDHLEVKGIHSTGNAIQQADLVLMVTDVNSPPVESDLAQLVRQKPQLHVINKCDLIDQDELLRLRSLFPSSILVSAETGKNISTMMNEVIQKTVGPDADRLVAHGKAVPFLVSQSRGIREVIQHLESGHIESAIHALSSLRFARDAIPGEQPKST